MRRDSLAEFHLTASARRLLLRSFHVSRCAMDAAQDEVESLKTALDGGALDYIAKPVNRIELLARVRSGLK